MNLIQFPRALLSLTTEEQVAYQPLRIPSIETQHEQLWLMMFYKILHGLSNLQMPNCIIPATGSTCGMVLDSIKPSS